MTKQPLVLQRAAMDDVTVRTAIPYGDDGRVFDLYLPDDPPEPPPVVVLATGYADAAMAAMLGCPLKDMQGYIDWARLLASEGLAAVTYVNRDPANDLAAVLEHLRGSELEIDATRIGLWAASGNVPNAVGMLRADGGKTVRCAALLYGYVLDIDGADDVSTAANQFRFVDPGVQLSEVPRVPTMLVRAGADAMPGINACIDRFTAAALAADFPLTLVNHAGGPHAFDLTDDRAEARTVIEGVLRFLATHLRRA